MSEATWLMMNLLILMDNVAMSFMKTTALFLYPAHFNLAFGFFTRRHCGLAFGSGGVYLYTIVVVNSRY
jgi:hypothetical protein